MPFVYFAFFVPVVMLVFSVAFMIAARSGSRAARYWAVAHLMIAGGFGVPVLQGHIPIQLQALLADGFFLAGAVLFSQALLIRFNAPRHLGFLGGLALATYIVVAWAVLIAGSLTMELGVADAATCVLWLFPLFVVARRLRAPIDWALAAVTVLIVLDVVVRNIVVYGTGQGSDGIESFGESSYAFFMQASSAILGLLFSLVALASVSIDLLGKYRRQAEFDPLTNLLNRRGFDEAIARLRTAGPLSGSMVICDIDHFKRINDDFGHAVGDRVLVGLSALLRRHCLASDLIARYGGEEFVIFMAEQDAQAAFERSEAIRLQIAASDWRDVGLDRRVTASFGIAGMGGENIENALERADVALYRAKSGGRNTVVAADVVSPAGPSNVTPLPRRARRH